VTNVIEPSRAAIILPAMAWLYDLGSWLLGAVAANPVVALMAAVVIAVVLAALARRLGVVDRVRRHPRATLALLVPILAVALPVGWYLTSPLILTASINEPAPDVTTLGAGPRESASPPRSPTAETVPAGSAKQTVAPSASAAPNATPALIARSGTFRGSDDFHFGRGTARLIEAAPGSFVVRLEDFAVRNGPDLYVYLSPNPDGQVEGAIELGRLKADTGNQNYSLPAGVLDDPSRAATVVIWCKQFSHLFATATLAA
jgi:hypothetical protein